MSGDSLTMGYFDNLDNRPLNKYKKNLKNRKSPSKTVNGTVANYMKI
jgi:hypothetical protein